MSDLLALTREIDRLTREKSEATSDLICAHREIERHKAEITRLDGEVAKLKRELRYARYFEVDDECIKSMTSGLEEATASHPALYSIVDDTLNNMIQLLRQRDEARRERDDMRPVYEAAKEWHVARCTRMPSCDPYVGSHDAECLLAIAESGLVNAVAGALASENGSGIPREVTHGAAVNATAPETASAAQDTPRERLRTDSIGRCFVCGYEGPGPAHDCKPMRNTTDAK